MESQIVAVKDQPASVDERKAQLIRQGEFHRVGVMHAKAQVKHAARPEALFHSAWQSCWPGSGFTFSNGVPGSPSTNDSGLRAGIR
jgi:hypothetical protein